MTPPLPPWARKPPPSGLPDCCRRRCWCGEAVAEAEAARTGIGAVVPVEVGTRAIRSNRAPLFLSRAAADAVGGVGGWSLLRSTRRPKLIWMSMTS